MRSSRWAAGAIAALSAIGALGGIAAAAPTSIRQVVHFPANGPGGQNSHTCFWGVSYTQETRNIVWPDSHTNYAVTTDTIPAGGKIVLHGRFPHSRFFSFTASSTLGVIRNYLYDVNIKPDKGSTNPFLAGANRKSTNRSYTVTVVDQPDPGAGHRQPNTVYAGGAGQTGGPFLLIERVYLPDQGRDFSGGVGEPTATYIAANGTTSAGQAACSALSTKPGAANMIDVNKIVFPESKIQQLLAMSSSPEHPAVDPGRWYKYFTPLRLLEPFYAGTSLASQIPSLPTVGTGLGANPANAFLYAWVDRTFGPDRHGHNIVVLRGKLPTTPATYAGEPRMQGETQLRYWSVCNGEGLTSGKTTGPCLADEEVPISAQRDYTIVISLPQDRPSNATDSCGVAWMSYGATGDGYTRPRTTMLIMRNQAVVAHPAFPQAGQNVTAPGTEKQVMGAYLPTITYTTAAQFRKTGCKTA